VNKNSATAFLAVLIVLSLFSVLVPSHISAGESPEVFLQVGQSVKILAPESSNISLISISGKGEYNLQISKLFSTSELDFTPSSEGVYALDVNVSSSGDNYATVEKVAGAGSSVLDNFTSNGGSIALNMAVSVAGVQAQNPSWNPFFGMTGVSIRGFSVPFPAVVLIIFAIGVGFVIMGNKFASSLIYIGVATIAISGIMVVGFIVVFAAVIAYVGSFVLIRFVWGTDTNRGGQRPQ
jgi:hypothetical protein